MENDYSLLRAFDEERAKAGEAICFAGSRKVVLYIAGPDKAANIVCDVDGYLRDYFHTALRLAPLCWVEGKPVYKGDVLWHIHHGRVTVTGLGETTSVGSFEPCVTVAEKIIGLPWIRALTWSQPQPAAPSEYNRLAKIIQEGRDARDSGEGNPYELSVESLMHAQGWIERDLRIALDAEREKNRVLNGFLVCLSADVRQIDVPQSILDAAKTIGEFFEQNTSRTGKSESARRARTRRRLMATEMAGFSCRSSRQAERSSGTGKSTPTRKWLNESS